MRFPKGMNRSLHTATLCTIATINLFLFPGAAQAQQHATTFDTARSEQWIPYEGGDSHLIVIPAVVNGEQIHALVDTGTSETVLSLDWAKKHSLPLRPTEASSALGGAQVQIYAAPFNSFAFGVLGTAHGEMHVADLSGFRAAAADHPFDMMIGFDLLSHFAIDIEAEHQRIRFRMTGARPPAGHLVPLRIDPQNGHFFTSLYLEGKAMGSVMIDTGENSSLAVAKTVIGDYPKTLRVTDVMKSGASGLLIVDYALSDHVRWGDVTAERVPTEFESKPPTPATAVRIGMEFLERWNVFMDGAKGVMVLSDRQQPAAPAHTTNTGIQFNPTAAGMAAVHVMKNSPAQAAGLKDGDLICAADGNSITTTSPIPRGPDGSIMNLTLCDGRKISFKREMFY